MPVVDNGFFSALLIFWGRNIREIAGKVLMCGDEMCGWGCFFFFAEFGPIFISSSLRGAISTAGAATWKMNKTFETLLYLK